MAKLSTKELKQEVAIIKRDLPAFEDYRNERKSAGDKAGAYYWQTKIEESNKRLKEIDNFIELYNAKVSKPAPAKKKAVSRK